MVGGGGGGGDVYARYLSGSSSGRGSIAGWTPCPLCSTSQTTTTLFSLSSFSSQTIITSYGDGGDDNKEESCYNKEANIISSSSSLNQPPLKSKTKSVKLFSHGRGLSAHIHAVHTPWNPGKAEVKRREALQKRVVNEARRLRRQGNNHNNNVDDDDDDDDTQQNVLKKRKYCKISADSNHNDANNNNHADDDDALEYNRNDLNNIIPRGKKWEPTQDEIEQWNQRVIEIVALVEFNSKKKMAEVIDNCRTTSCSHTDRGGGIDRSNDNNVCNKGKLPPEIHARNIRITSVGGGHDKSGNTCLPYRESLPPFLAAAANGDLLLMKQMILHEDTHDHDAIADSAKYTIHKDNTEDHSVVHCHTQQRQQERIHVLLSMRDRNGSTAEHWAAGGGHLDCLTYLLDMRDRWLVPTDKNYDLDGNESERSTYQSSSAASALSVNSNNDGTIALTEKKKLRRRRDGKTSLHYAARNGHIHIIDMILSRQERQHQRHDHDDDNDHRDTSHVDIPSGDGTTPLHMACYGGHFRTVRHLIETHGANIRALNDWECSAAHWAAMSLGSEGNEMVLELCHYLKVQLGAEYYVRAQRQGHTPLHKAASRRNRHVIEWMATGSVFNDEERKLLGALDMGGNRPSDIWLSVGGEEDFGLWMKEEWNW